MIKIKRIQQNMDQVDLYARDQVIGTLLIDYEKGKYFFTLNGLIGCHISIFEANSILQAYFVEDPSDYIKPQKEIAEMLKNIRSVMEPTTCDQLYFEQGLIVALEWVLTKEKDLEVDEFTELIYMTDNKADWEDFFKKFEGV